MNIDERKKKYPKLSSLFAGELHPDWDVDHNTVNDVIIAFAIKIATNDLLDTLLEIKNLKIEFNNEQDLRQVIDVSFALQYAVSLDEMKLTAFEWLDLISSIIKEELRKRKK